MINKRMWKEAVGIFRYCPDILEGVRKNTKNLRIGGLQPRFEPRIPEYEVG
jgi:hypothetical protein